MSAIDRRWRLHLTTLDRDALGPERAEQLTRSLRLIEEDRLKLAEALRVYWHNSQCDRCGAEDAHICVNCKRVMALLPDDCELEPAAIPSSAGYSSNHQEKKR